MRPLTSQRRTWLIASTLGGVFICAAGAYVFRMYRAMDEKVAAANVVRVALKHRGDRDTASPLIDRTDYGSRWVVLGLPSHDPDFHRVWIILDATPGGTVIKRPDDERFDLKCGYLKNLEQHVDIDPDVDTFLASRCHP